MYSLIGHFSSITIGRTAALAPQWKSFDSCCKVVDLILAAKYGLVPPREAPPKLRELVESFMTAHVSVYGDAHIKPKHAWQWAIICHWLRDNKVYDAFIVERLHLTIKSQAERVDYTLRGERSVLSCVLLKTTSNLQECQGSSYLKGVPTQLDDYPNALFAGSMQICDASLHVGDVVVY